MPISASQNMKSYSTFWLGRSRMYLLHFNFGPPQSSAFARQHLYESDCHLCPDRSVCEWQLLIAYHIFSHSSRLVDSGWSCGSAAKASPLLSLIHI